MYKTIYVPVDNSDYSNQAIEVAVQLGKRLESTMVGCHVYAAKMHDYRFKQMEFTLPDEYLEENELDRQRKIHDSLITMGLQLISDSYLQPMHKRCVEEELEFVPRTMDGKHSTEIVNDIKTGEYDLVVLGIMGLGQVRDSQIGSVCERVARESDRDVLVVKRVPNGKPVEASDTILVGLDGSPQSFGALMTAIDLAEKFDKKIETIAVYDPYLHYSVFNGIVGVLTEKAAKVFRFEEQNQLHEEIIDTGLAQIYQSHLEVADKIAKDRGVEITKTLLDGKAFQKILDHARKTNPWLVVLGRVGIHNAEGHTGLGSNTENLLRSCPSDILLTTRLHHPELDVRAEETIRWTPEAEERMERVPDMVRGIARTAIFRLAVEKGHSVITSDLLDEAMDRYMPKSTAKVTAQLAEGLVLEKARERPISMCKSCGVTASEPEPVKCGVCGGETFDVITPEQVEEIIKLEGGIEVDTTYDGRKLKWTQDAKRALWTMDDAYQRRRTKARVEKSARMNRLNAITLDFARAIVEEESGKPLVLPERPEGVANGAEAPVEAVETREDGKKLVARDSKNNPLFSAFTWTPDAVKRVQRVPAGFMRDRTQNRIEDLAAERDTGTIDLDLVEEGIEFGRQEMAAMLGQYNKDPKATREAASGMPADGAANGNDDADSVSNEHGGGASNGTSGSSGPALNEISMLSSPRRSE